MATHYLYGAAVQGIQDFIFRTNELKDIAGASELVENICTSMFEEFAYEEEIIQGAAGNIKCLFDSEERCRRAVREFPKKVMQTTPGITMSQAVVNWDDQVQTYEEVAHELERRLRVQRNQPILGLNTGLLGMLRSRSTGLPAVKQEKQDFLDRDTIAKRQYSKPSRSGSTLQKLCQKNFGAPVRTEDIAFNVEDLTQTNDWIAVVHADGNGLGQVVRRVGGDAQKLRKFSRDLDDATSGAAQQAFHDTYEQQHLSEREKRSKIPFRPVVLGGDDHTIILRGDLAVPYTLAFIRHFEENTLEKIGTRLTACAGIAFVKSGYPFYYAYDLAEKLCREAKIDAKAGLDMDKDMPASCLKFYKVQDSFTLDWNNIVERELTPQKNVSFNFWPYYLDSTNAKSGRWTIEQLSRHAAVLSSEKGNAIKSGLRKWMGLMHEDDNKAAQWLDRMQTIASLHAGRGSNEMKMLCDVTQGQTKDGTTRYPVYDLLTLVTINNQITK